MTTALYKVYRTCLTNHMVFMSCYIMLLDINSLGGGHTHTCAHMHMQVRNQLPRQKQF